MSVVVIVWLGFKLNHLIQMCIIKFDYDISILTSRVTLSSTCLSKSQSFVTISFRHLPRLIVQNVGSMQYHKHCTYDILLFKKLESGAILDS